MAVGFCSCPSDLYRCDETEGCVCKDGFDCEGGTQFIDFASLQVNNKETDPIFTCLIVDKVFSYGSLLFVAWNVSNEQKDASFMSNERFEMSFFCFPLELPVFARIMC